MICPTGCKIKTVVRNYMNVAVYGHVNWRVSAQWNCKGPSRYMKLVILGDAKLEEIIPCRTGFVRRILNELTPTYIKRGM
jgi:hypothetical protein